MADFASIPGGSDTVGIFDPSIVSSVDAFYNISSGGLGAFIDRGNATGNTEVDGSGALDAVTFKGGIGDDVFQGSVNGDTVNAGGGNDYISAGEGNNYILGGAGNDTIVAGNGNDTLIGDDGDDVIFGGDGDNVIQGGAGNDTLTAGSGDDSISGGSGHDYIWGGDGNDTLLGGDGDDTLIGGRGDDLLMGGAGNDLFVFSSDHGGNDTIVGFTAGDEVQIEGDPISFSVQGQAGFDPSATNKIELIGSSVKITMGADTILIKGITGSSPADLLNNLDWLKVGPA
jgi:Ca2+-binding RTX toxin-like protein